MRVAEGAIIMGSQSEWPAMRHAADTPEALGILFETRIVSAHRTPKRLYDFAQRARQSGLRVSGAGGAAHLPGMTAALTPLPVFGVPVGTLAIGKAGAINAALLAASVLALSDARLAKRLDVHRDKQTRAVRASPVDEPRDGK